jgi:hypothetical protein
LGLLDGSGNFIELKVAAAATRRNMAFSGPAPEANLQSQRAMQNLWAIVTGRGSGGYEQHWFPETMSRIIQHSLPTINPHYIPSFRQIPTRMDDFADEYPQAGETAHIIDQLAGLAYPAYTEQTKKKDFERLRKFVGDIIDDPDVAIEIPNDRSTVNVRTGDTFLPIEALGSGIHEVFMLASEVVLRSGSTILLEEPEVHLHPHLQRRFMRFIMDDTKNQFFITTHSATIIDTAGAQVFGVRSDGDGAHVRALVTSQDRFNACRELGFKASDLLQTNCVVWVEGPSDRIYIQSWISAVAPDLVEGLDYSIIFYGGKLLSHLSAEDREVEDFISILPLCRRAAMILDSDFSGSGQTLRATKLRVIEELRSVGGFSWVTAGREIENYYPHDDRETVVRAVHPTAARLTGNRNRYEKPLAFERADGSRSEQGFDKVAIARGLVGHSAIPIGQLDLQERLTGLVQFIRASNA